MFDELEKGLAKTASALEKAVESFSEKEKSASNDNGIKSAALATVYIEVETQKFLKELRGK